ncbi:type II toxin-antitoxin system RelE/ParE family toxin [Occultella aeris]|uniref:Toxin RelE n=1 Tax=Occultella aeris TaxID=2761496 RepID=A0A7M4DES1_9MICO|nr:type II toxin-antitoxin system RelE/ParE family toxin [Occultella aeris]VZO35414.1 Toxin RelE [Occultella aeris]
MTAAEGEWEVVVTAGAARALERLPEKIAVAVVEFITGQLPTNPRRMSKPLRNELEAWHSARRGDYRVTFRIDEERHALIIGRIEHRSTVYKAR